VSTIVDQQGLAGGSVEGFVQRAPGQISPMADVYEPGDGQGSQGRSRVTLVPQRHQLRAGLEEILRHRTYQFYRCEIVLNLFTGGEVFYVSKDFGILGADCIRALHKSRICQGKEVKTKRTRSSPGRYPNVLRSRDKS